jgi:7,8-dihydropterin-6-yl-methyl-4-(beta-D-ribofuranosyl)aminobenzene 5'-phosphate synthase
MRCLLFFLVCSVSAVAQSPRAKAVKIQILSTMLADQRGLGEWGFGALVEVDGKRILFDTGARPDVVLKNAAELKVNLADVEDVILSHNHGDHTGGLLALKKEFGAKALVRVHVGKGIFAERPDGNMKRVREGFEGMGGRFVEYDSPKQIAPGVWLTGPVPRVHPERNWSGSPVVITPKGRIDDTIAEDMSLVIDTDKGLIVLTGCGHAGVVNTVEYARKTVREAPVHALIGGLHLFALNDQQLAWTGGELKEAGVQNLLGAHCTGVEAVYRLRSIIGLDRETAAVAAVGALFELGKPISPGVISR